MDNVAYPQSLVPESSSESSPASPAILVENLVKHYGDHVAVGGISFDVFPGEIFALLGPNGAGKTTTIEILEGFRPPDAGIVRVLGFDPGTQGRRMKEQVGIMLQEGGLYPAITPREALSLFAGFYEHPRSVDDLLSLAGLEDAARTRYRRLSGGQKQRLRLALALLNEPRLIFLDEPTAGLDAHARRATWSLIGGLRDRGTTVLLTTHYLEEAEKLADRVAILDRGRIIALDAPDTLTRRDEAVVRLRAQGTVPCELLRALPAAAAVYESDDSWLIDTDNPAQLLAEVTTALRDAAIPITELRVGAGSLEDVFLQLTGREYDQ